MSVRKGARRRPERERFWREVIQGWRRSGLSVRAWCERRDVAEPSFYAWRRELARRDRQAQVAPQQRAGFVPVQLVTAALGGSGAVLEIELPNRVRLRLSSGCDAQMLNTAFRVLQSVCGEEQAC